MGANKNLVSEELMSLLWMNQMKPVLVYIISDLILITERVISSNLEGEYKYLNHIHLQAESVVKDMPDTYFFTNMMTIIGENESLTFICES